MQPPGASLRTSRAADHAPNSTHSDHENVKPTPLEQFVRYREYGIVPNEYPVRTIRPAFAPTDPVFLAPSILPTGGTFISMESSFFLRHERLPSPAEVRAAQTGARRRSQTLAFPPLGLLVKHGTATIIAEAQCMWAVRHLLADKVPVPEVYGWCTDGATSEVFIYMELVSGVTLAEAWPLYTEPQRLDVCRQLRDMLSNLRRLQQDTGSDRLIGSISSGPLADCIFAHEALNPAGPFDSVAAFHDHYAVKLWRARHGDAYEDPYRGMLHDEAGIAFSHNDLSFGNILVANASPDRPPRVVAIIDWHQAGWVPDYWEYYKTRWLHDEEWSRKYLPLILDDPNEEDDYWYWFAYTHMMGIA